MCDCSLNNYFSCPDNSICCLKYETSMDPLTGSCNWNMGSSGKCDNIPVSKSYRRYDGHVYCNDGFIVQCNNSDTPFMYGKNCDIDIPFSSGTCECVSMVNKNIELEMHEFDIDTETNLHSPKPNKYTFTFIIPLAIIIALLYKKYKTKQNKTVTNPMLNV